MTRSWADLAIFGGAAAFAEPLFVGRPNLGSRDRLLERINDILDRRYLTNSGPYEVQFESRIAAYLGVKHCVAVCNATVGLEIAIRALDLEGEVIVPSFTFVASAHVLEWLGITPVFCDIAPGSAGIDADRIDELVTARTTAIMGVHLWGRACDTAGLEAAAGRHGLRLLFDAAHAFGCSHTGRMVGSFGDAEVFSFHATKFLNSFEGGAITTNDDTVARQARLMRNFGFVDYDQVAGVGVNGKMSEVSAAMGLTSLEAIDEIIARNRGNYVAYAQCLTGIPGISLLAYDGDERSNYQAVVLTVDEASAGVTRDQLYRILHGENVVARRYFHPGCHRQEPYRSRDPEAGTRLRETERLSARVLALPTGSAVGTEDIVRICDVIRLVQRDADAIRAHWSDALVRPPADAAVPATVRPHGDRESV